MKLLEFTGEMMHRYFQQVILRSKKKLRQTSKRQRQTSCNSRTDKSSDTAQCSADKHDSVILSSQIVCLLRSLITKLFEGLFDVEQCLAGKVILHVPEVGATPLEQLLAIHELTQTNCTSIQVLILKNIYFN